jgi:deoxycytidine triphosphate deaminase/chaperonin cofactor prefoldin
VVSCTLNWIIYEPLGLLISLKMTNLIRLGRVLAKSPNPQSMFLNHEEIKLKNLIKPAIAEEFSNASYNLTVKYIIDMNGKKIEDQYRLKPQGMVYVVFNETVTMPPDLIAFAHVKTALTKRGIMATNIGIIDPTYNGLISTLLINFGKADFVITKDDPALRISFADINAPKTLLKVNGNNLEENVYVKNVQKDIGNLEEKFLNLNSVEKEVRDSVIASLIKIGVVFTIGAFLVGLYFQKKNSSEKDLERSIKKYEIELATLEAQNNLLNEKISAYESKLNEKDTIFQKKLSLYQDEFKKFKENTEKQLKSLSKRQQILNQN